VQGAASSNLAAPTKFNFDRKTCRSCSVEETKQAVEIQPFLTA
jgi:hypothetical protein